jgi:hypothetical protein
VKQTAKFDIALVCLTGFMRSAATGLVGVVLGVYLFRLGHGSTHIGVVTAAGLAGAAVATAFITFRRDLARKQSLIFLALLWFLGGLGFALVSNFAGLVFFVFVGMVNAMGTDRSAAYALEQAALPSW